MPQNKEKEKLIGQILQTYMLINSPNSLFFKDLQQDHFYWVK